MIWYNLILPFVIATTPVNATTIGANVNSNNGATTTEIHCSGSYPTLNQFILGDFNENKRDFYTKLGVNTPVISSKILMNLGSETQKDQQTTVARTISAQREITESAFYDQKNDNTNTTLGVGIGDPGFGSDGEGIGVEYKWFTSNTDGTLDGKSEYNERYGNNLEHSIIVNNENQTKSDVNRTDNDLRVGGSCFINKFNVGLDLYGNWNSMATSGSTVLNTTVNSDGNISTYQNYNSFGESKKRATYTVKPRIEQRDSENKEKVRYGYAELPIHVGDCNGAGFNGGVAWNNQGKLLFSGNLSSDFGEATETINLGANMFYSNNTSEAFSALAGMIKGDMERASSPLCLYGERRIRSDIASDGFARKLNGFGGGLELKLQEKDEAFVDFKPEYGAHIVAGVNGYYGAVSASTIDHDNYSISAAGGGNKFSASVSCGKINGDDVYSGGITLRL
jgi:hypothetical protein